MLKQEEVTPPAEIEITKNLGFMKAPGGFLDGGLLTLAPGTKVVVKREPFKTREAGMHVEIEPIGGYAFAYWAEFRKATKLIKAGNPLPPSAPKVKKPTRTMPPAGYYIWDEANHPTGGNEIIHVTGTTKGNQYRRRRKLPDGNWSNDDSWANLLWTCVPSKKDLDKYYIYHPNKPSGWWDQ